MKSGHKDKRSLLTQKQQILVPIGFLAITVGVLFASCQKRSTGANLSSTQAPIDKSQYSPVGDSGEAFVMVAKRMMGLNPKAGDAHDHMGLMNLADMLGFKYPFESCQANWISDVNSTNEVTIYAPHSNGRNQACNERDTGAATHYVFKNWYILSNSATEVSPYETVPENNELPALPAPVVGAEMLADQAQVKIVDGRLVVITPEVITVTGHNKSTDSQELAVTYTRTISTAHSITQTDQKMHEVDVGITVTAEGGFAPFAKVSAALNTTYKYSTSKSKADTTSNATTTTVFCSSSVKQKPGCSYRLKIQANYMQTKGRYIGYISARPSTVTLSGDLTDDKDCQSKPYRRKNGSCKNERVVENLGTESMSYDVDLKNRLSGGDGSWYWESLRTIPGQKQADGSANIDILTNYLTKGDFDKFSINFEDVTESVTDCTASIEVIAGGDECRTNDPVVNSTSR